MWSPTSLLVRSFSLLCAAAGPATLIVPAAAPAGDPIVAVRPELDRLQKWNDMCGDTADPFWADDDRFYHFTCDGRGFGTQPRNFCFNRLDGSDLATLRGVLVNSMDEYGKGGAAAPDGSNWKVCGQECIDGVFYAFVACNKYGKDSKDPLMRQTSYNASLIKSHDRGRTWTRTAKENYDQPMWPGTRFGAPGFIHYGKDGGRVTNDAADQYVYALSNNGFWNGGDHFILARVRRADLPHLLAADWTYYADGAWMPDLAQATPVLERPGQLGWTAPTFIPALNRYLLVSWYVSPTLKKWFEPGRVTYDFFEAPHPWGPWTFVSSFDDRFLAPGQHMYGPNLCAKYQETRGDAVEVQLFTSGCPFEDKPTGLYKNWRIPLRVMTKPPPAGTLVNDDHPALRYTGDWQALKRPERGYGGGDIHATQAMGAALDFDFVGTGIEVVSEKFNDLGQVEVFIDGQSRGVVNLKQVDFPRLVGITVFRASDLPPGRHTLRLVNRSAAWLTVDAFVVTGAAGDQAGQQSAVATPAAPAAVAGTSSARAARLAWWQDAKFGMFIHWGLYALPAGEWKGTYHDGIGEWIMFKARIPIADYEELARQFNPVKFDAEAWAQLAEDAGMKYLIITAKHHDGFAMYGSKADPFNIVDATPFRRDPMKELAAACAKRGIKFGFYYSQAQDWTAPGGAIWEGRHENGPVWEKTRWDPRQEGDFDAYLARKALPQVRELLTGYGPIAVVWFDTPLKVMSVERAGRFEQLVRELQPQCLISGRLGGQSQSDYASEGDNRIPNLARTGAWETPATLNDTWGFKKHDHNWKKPEDLTFKLVDIVSKGGNYLLNVGPDGEGMIPQPSQDMLRAVGRWLKVNGEAIYGAGRSPFGVEFGAFDPAHQDSKGQPAFTPKQDWRCTTQPGKIYFHFFQWPGGSVELPAVAGRVAKATLLAAPDAAVGVKQTESGTTLTLPAQAPDAVASVVRLELE